jgi:hypothetical protein
MIGMFFNRTLKGMDVRSEQVLQPKAVETVAQDGETMLASRTTDIH